MRSALLIAGPSHMLEAASQGFDLVFVRVFLAFREFERFEHFLHVIQRFLEGGDDAVDFFDRLSDRSRSTSTRLLNGMAFRRRFAELSLLFVAMAFFMVRLLNSLLGLVRSGGALGSRFSRGRRCLVQWFGWPGATAASSTPSPAPAAASSGTGCNGRCCFGAGCCCG